MFKNLTHLRLICLTNLYVTLLTVEVSGPVTSQTLKLEKLISDELFEIRRERTVELGAEGFRFDDIMRWAAYNLVKGKRPKGYPFNATDWAGNINYKTDADGFLDPYAGQTPAGMYLMLVAIILNLFH